MAPLKFLVAHLCLAALFTFFFCDLKGQIQIYDMKASDGYYYKAGYFWSNDSLVVFGDSVLDMFSNLDRRQVGYLAQYDMNMELTNLALGLSLIHI